VRLSVAEHVKRADAESKASKLESQLAETQRQLTDARMNKAHLTDELAKAGLKLKKEEDQHKETFLSRAKEEAFLRARLAKQAADAKEETENLRGSLSKASLKASETDKKLSETEKKLSETEKKRQEADSKTARVAETADILKKMQADTEDRLANARRKSQETAEVNRKFRAAATKGMSNFKAAMKQQLAEAERHTTDEAQKHAETVKQLEESRRQKEVAEQKMQVAQAGQQHAELRTFRLAVRGAVRGGTGVVQNDGTVKHWRIR